LGGGHFERTGGGGGKAVGPQSRRMSGSGRVPLRPSAEGCGNPGVRAGTAEWTLSRLLGTGPGRGHCKHRLGPGSVHPGRATAVASGPENGWSRATGRSLVGAVRPVGDSKKDAGGEEPGALGQGVDSCNPERLDARHGL